MNTLSKTLITILLSLTLSANLLAADLQKGIEAADSGDYATALKEFESLAKQGDVDAQYNLGVMYRDGEGVPKDYSEAIKWFTLSARQGNVDAQYNLGVIYFNGQGVPKDYILTYAWLNVAATSGDKEAINSRDRLEKDMTPSQIEKAQAKTKELMKTIKKGAN